MLEWQTRYAKSLREDEPFAWTFEREERLEQLKCFQVWKLLQIFNHQGPDVVKTDTCNYWMFAVLEQLKGQDIVTAAFPSRTLTRQQRKYSAGEHLVLACVWACEYWRACLWGRSFTLQNDPQSLVTIMGAQGIWPSTISNCHMVCKISWTQHYGDIHKGWRQLSDRWLLTTTSE